MPLYLIETSNVCKCNYAILYPAISNYCIIAGFLQVDTAGQRGFRRRCLDFDASGARRRSLGSKKPTGSRLKECSGTTVVINNDESPVLGNVIPDATASRLEDNSSNANGTSDSGSHPRGES